MKTPEERQAELKRLNALREFASSTVEQAQKQRGHCTSLENNGRKMLIDIPQDKELRREKPLDNMIDEKFQELMGLSS